MPKKMAKDIARQVKQLGEEVIKEGARQPVELIKIAGKQIGALPRGWGEKPETRLSARTIQEKREREEKALAFARKRIKEMTLEPSQPEPEKTPEEIERQRKLAEEAEKKKPVPEVGKKPRTPLGVKIRTKKSRAELGEWRRTG